MPGKYAAKTQVSPDRSRDEIEQTLRRYGADAFSYGWEENRAVIMFAAEGRRIRLDIEVPPESEFRSKAAREQAIRQRWRALVLVVKAKLEAVASGIVSFEEEFLANIVLADGTRVSDWMAPQLEAVYDSGQMPELLPPARAAIGRGGSR